MAAGSHPLQQNPDLTTANSTSNDGTNHFIAILSPAGHPFFWLKPPGEMGTVDCRHDKPSAFAFHHSPLALLALRLPPSCL
jgi:hypothetical protein